MLGSFAVGKTSLVRRYVDSIFSENYVTTIGVKIDKKQISANDTELALILWDVYGDDNYQSVLPSYLRGLAAYILVIDPSRPATFESAKKLLRPLHRAAAPKFWIQVQPTPWPRVCK